MDARGWKRSRAFLSNRRRKETSTPSARAVLLGAMAEQKRWTQTDITELRARLELGDTAEAIGELLDRSTVDIFGMMSRLSLRVRTSS
jgi:hypothetical protein